MHFSHRDFGPTAPCPGRLPWSFVYVLCLAARKAEEHSAQVGLVPQRRTCGRRGFRVRSAHGTSRPRDSFEILLVATAEYDIHLGGVTSSGCVMPSARNDAARDETSFSTKSNKMSPARLAEHAKLSNLALATRTSLEIWLFHARITSRPDKTRMVSHRSKIIQGPSLALGPWASKTRNGQLVGPSFRSQWFGRPIFLKNGFSEMGPVTWFWAHFSEGKKL